MKRLHLAIILIALIVTALSSITIAMLGNSQTGFSNQSEVPIEPEPENDLPTKLDPEQEGQKPNGQESLIEPEPETEQEPEIVYYTYEVVQVYPHDEKAFTQGLVFRECMFYEGTGLYGQSTLRCVELENGNVTQQFYLPEDVFGEGITIFEDKIIQLTWKSRKGFVYNLDSFELLCVFEYPTDGWGITHNGTMLIMSVGNSTLYFLDPETFQIISQIEVYDDDHKEFVSYLNELEYVNGKIYANVWTEDRIVIIDPETGKVIGWIDLSSINDSDKTNMDNVLNGIAYDTENDRLFVTGKRWSKIFEIKLIEVK